MSMRTEHSGNPAIKIPTECHFLRCGFGVEVDQDDPGTDAREQAIGGTEGIVIGLHKDPALQVEDGVGDARGGERALIKTKAGSARRIVCGADYAARPIMTFR